MVQEEWWKNKMVTEASGPQLNLKEDETETFMKKTTTVMQEEDGAYVVKEEMKQGREPSTEGVYGEKPGYFDSFDKEDISKWKMLSSEMHSKVQKMIPLKISSLEPL